MTCKIRMRIHILGWWAASKKKNHGNDIAWNVERNGTGWIGWNTMFSCKYGRSTCFLSYHVLCGVFYIAHDLDMEHLGGDSLVYGHIGSS